jgi:peptide/nickel transport system substrate-binding protein
MRFKASSLMIQKEACHTASTQDTKAEFHFGKYGYNDRMIAKRLSALIFLAAACVSAEAKTLRIGVTLLPPTQAAPFNSLNLAPSMTLQAIYDTMTKMSPDGTVLPNLAVSWVQEAPTRWVITLRDNVVFSNGEALSSEAVVTAFNYLLTPAGRAESVGSQMNNLTVQGVKARDRLSFEINTKIPDAILPLHLMFLRAPAPAAWRKLGPEAYARAPVGTGPFVLERWADGKVDLRANATSWRAPKLERLEILRIMDQAARVQALTSGAIDVAYGITPEERETIEAAGGTLLTYRIPEVSFLAMVTVKDSPVKDVRVRRALNMAVNRQRIIDSILDGATKPAAQIAHPQSYGFNPDLLPYPYDPEQAKKLLTEAGYEKGFDLPALLVGNANNYDSIYQQIGADLAEVGVRLELRRHTLAKQMEYVYQGGWPSLAFAMSTNGYDPMNAYRIRSCGWVNPYHCDPAMMPLIEAARTATEPEQRRALTQKVLAAERENPPGIFLWQVPYFDGVAKRVTGYRASEEYIPFHEIDVVD